MNTLLVGGRTSYIRKESGVIRKMGEYFSRDHFVRVINGKPLPKDISGADLTIWAPDIPNSADKNYPKKDVGSVLICTKFMREGVSRFDAVSRIFKMGANAVLAIYPRAGLFKFELIDALGNSWCEPTTALIKIVDVICGFYKWSNGQKRQSIKRLFMVDPELVRVNRIAAAMVQNSSGGGRFFGNSSTRCMKLFPSEKLSENHFFFSARNVDKEHITERDFVLICRPKLTDTEDGAGREAISYGPQKPSVDTPVQLLLYDHLPNITCMIHGHAYLNNVATTEEYFPCGDLREAMHLLNLLNPKCFNFGINLKNHGFLIGAHNVAELSAHINHSKFILPEILRQ